MMHQPLAFPSFREYQLLMTNHWSLCLHNHMTFSSSVSHNVKVSADCQLDRIQNHLGIPVTITWCTCENHLVYLWESPSVPMRTTWCTCENSLVVPVRIALMYLWAITFVVLTDVETPIFSMGRTIPWLRSSVTKRQALLSASRLGMRCHRLPHAAAGISLLR